MKGSQPLNPLFFFLIVPATSLFLTAPVDGAPQEEGWLMDWDGKGLAGEIEAEMKTIFNGAVRGSH
jgi:hypothetical protein